MSVSIGWLAAFGAAALLVSGCQSVPTLSDSRKGPLFCDEAPNPKRYLKTSEIDVLEDDMIDVFLTLQARGKKHCGWNLSNPNEKETQHD